MADDAADRLRLIRSANIGPVTYAQLIARFGTASAALAAIPALAVRGGGRAPVLADPRLVAREQAAVAKLGARYLFWGSPTIPRCSRRPTLRRPR